MFGHFGFSYVGLIFMIMLIVPNIIWAKNQPQGYSAENENKVLAVFERIGEMLATCCGPKGDREAEVKRITNTLMEGEKQGLSLDFMFCCNGDKDIAYEEHIEIMEKAVRECSILKQDENYDFFTIPGGIHDMKAWQLHLYHALQIFFH